MADKDGTGSIFTDEDVRRVLAEERGDGEQRGWSLANQSDNVEVWRKAEEGVSIHLLKARVHVRTCACVFVVLSLFVCAYILSNFSIKHAFNNAAQSLSCPMDSSHASCTATCTHT